MTTGGSTTFAVDWWSESQIETHVIPLLLARNQLDGAHAVGTRIGDALINVLRAYVERAMVNVRAILIMTMRALAVSPLESPGQDTQAYESVPLSC